LNYTDYRIYENSKSPETTSTEASPTPKAKKTWKQETKKGLSFNDQKEFNKIERDLKKLELEKKEIEALFANSTLDAEKINEESQKLQKIIEQIEEKEMRWLELSELMEE